MKRPIYQIVILCRRANWNSLLSTQPRAIQEWWIFSLNIKHLWKR